MSTIYQLLHFPITPSAVSVLSAFVFNSFQHINRRLIQQTQSFFIPIKTGIKSIFTHQQRKDAEHTYSRNCVTKRRVQTDHVLFSFRPIMCTWPLFGNVEHASSQSCGAFKLLMDNDANEKNQRISNLISKIANGNKLNGLGCRRTDEHTRVLW